MLSVTVFVLENAAIDVPLTATVFHEFIDPPIVVKPQPLILYSPPITEIAAGPLIPETVIVFEV